MEIRLICESEVSTVSANDVPDVLARDEGVVWIDMVYTDEPGMALLAELVDVRPADLADCSTRTPVPKLHVYPDHHFSAINGVARGADGRLYFQPLKTFLKERLFITVLGPTDPALTTDAAHRELTLLQNRIDGGLFRPTAAFELIAAIRFQMLQTQEELIGTVSSRARELEERMLQIDPVKAEALLRDLVALRHDLQTIGTNAAQTHEAYVQLIEVLAANAGLMRVNVQRVNEMRQAFGHLKNTTDLEREYLQEVADLFQTRVATELNRFVRKITAFGTIGIAWTVIAGIYGMNFTNMPELDWRFGYPFALCVMAAVGVLLATLFHREGWL